MFVRVSSQSWRHVRDSQWTSHVASVSKSASTSTFTCETALFCFSSFQRLEGCSQLITDSWDTNRNTRRGEFANYCRRKYALSCVILCSRKYRKIKRRRKWRFPGSDPSGAVLVVMHRLQLWLVLYCTGLFINGHSIISTINAF